MPTPHDITLPAAREKARRYHTVFPNATKALTIPASEIRAIIDQTGCDTFTIYFGLDDESNPDQRTAVFSGNDAGNTILPVLKDSAWLCPPNCVNGLL